MRDPMYLTLFHQDGERSGRVIETPVEAAVPKAQAVRQNELATHGTCQTLLAGTPLYWQRKLARALLAGAATGVTVTICISSLIQG